MRKLFTILTLLGAAAAFAPAAPVSDDDRYERRDPYYNYPATSRSTSELDKRYAKHAKEQRKLYERDRKAAEKMMKKSSSDREKYFRKHGSYQAPYYPPR